MRKRIVERPNSAIVKIIKEVYEQAKRGMIPNTKNLYLRVNPSLIDIELVFNEESESTPAIEKPKSEPSEGKSEVIAAINTAEKHKDLKSVAEKYGLEVKSNLRHPEALRKDLLSQVEDL